MIAGGFGFVVSLVWCLLLPGVVVFSGCWLFSGLFVVVGAGFLVAVWIVAFIVDSGSWCRFGLFG